MSKEEIKHFKSILRESSLRHMNILLDDKFQKELQTIIKNYEKLQQENDKLKKQYCKRTDCAGRIGNSKKVEKLKNENQQLKKQLEDKEDFINKLQATKDKLDKWNYEITMKQKEFIKYLEDMLDNENDIFSVVRVKDLLQKYKKIIGE